MSSSSPWNHLIAAELVRYEALFRQLGNIQALDDIGAIADQTAEQWKYIANVASWRLVVKSDDCYLVIDGFQGAARIEEVSQLSPWDEFHWTRRLPCLLTNGMPFAGPTPPEFLRGVSIAETIVLPYLHQAHCVGLLIAGALHVPFNDLDNKFIRLFGNQVVDHLLSVLARRSARELALELQANRIELELQNEELRHAQSLMEESRDRYVEFYDLALVGFLTLSRDARIASINLTGAALFGVERSKLLGHRFAKYIAATDQERWARHFLQVIQSPEKRSCEIALCSDCGARHLLVDSQQAAIRSGKTIIKLALIDITERKRNEQALHLAQERLSIAMRSLHSGVWDMDLVNETQVWSEDLFRLFGINPLVASASHATWLAMVHPDDREAAEACVNDAINYKIPLFNEYRVILPTGEPCWIESFGELGFDENRTPIRMTGISIDVTARKKMDLQLADLRADLQQTLEWQVARHTVAALAHELNQPLGSIAMLCEAARRLNLNMDIAARHDAEPILDRMAVESERAGAAVRNLLGSLQNVDIQREPASLAAIIGEAVRLSRADANVDAKCRLVADCAADLPLVMVNRLQVEKVLRNLIGNSIAAIRGCGRTKGWIGISAVLDADSQTVLVTIRDDGPGIDKVLQQKMFYPFVSGQSGGFGMGLTISRALVEAQSGKLWFTPPHGPGAQFQFTLPVAR